MDGYVRIVVRQNDLNRDPLQKKDAMLELRQAASTKTSRATRLT
jgi:hypothetical protein